MTDPRLPIREKSFEEQMRIKRAVHLLLLNATEIAGEDIGISGATFVFAGMGVWAAELAELDGRATAAYLRAMANIFDPSTTPEQKLSAEIDRKAATRTLFHAVNISMAEPEGRA